MREPRWIDRQVLKFLHGVAIAEHGGLSGLGDTDLLNSALARPRHLYACNPGSDIAQLAAACGFGLARNHAFIDGNKRIAFIATDLFLHINGHELAAEQIDQIRTMLSLASSQLSEEEFAVWIRAHLRKRV